MPFKVTKVGRGKYRVSSPSHVLSKGTSLGKAKRQLNLLRAVDHGWTPTRQAESLVDSLIAESPLCVERGCGESGDYGGYVSLRNNRAVMSLALSCEKAIGFDGSFIYADKPKVVNAVKDVVDRLQLNPEREDDDTTMGATYRLKLSQLKEFSGIPGFEHLKDVEKQMFLSQHDEPVVKLNDTMSYINGNDQLKLVKKMHDVTFVKSDYATTWATAIEALGHRLIDIGSYMAIVPIEDVDKTVRRIMKAAAELHAKKSETT